MNEVQLNYHRIQERISAVAMQAGKDPDGMRLVVVTKGQSVEKIQAVIEAGAIELGENYLEECIQKIELFKPIRELTWHMIGHIQSRKASGVCQYFNFVQSVDSLKLARRMSRALDDLNSEMPVLLEFNVSGEETKSGFPAWLEDHWGQLLPELREIVSQPRLCIKGLMTMAPYAQNAEAARPYFQRLSRLRDYLKTQIPEADWDELSMGMSADFEVAIQEGATIIRLGEAIMGKRK